MSLRDWFAGQAMSGFAPRLTPNSSDEDLTFIARLSYRMADAMLAEMSDD
ncbi:hypothetical protein [Amaricoccus sp. W119]